MTEESAADGFLIEWEDATRQALDSLARYKFWMFGYHAARVVYLATLVKRFGGPQLPNPFKRLVMLSREMYCRDCGELRQAEHRCTSESLTWQRTFEELPLLESGDRVAKRDQQSSAG